MEIQTVKNRIYLFCEYKKIPIAQFEQLCGLSNGYVSSMRKGFGREKLNNVLTQFPELNREWLLYGEGDMLKKNNINIETLKGTNINNSSFSELINQLKIKDEQIFRSQEQISKSQEQIDRLLSLLERK